MQGQPNAAIRNHELLGLCPVRELVRWECPGASAVVGPCLSTIDIDQVMRHRVDKYDWLGRTRLVEAQGGRTLSPLKAISYGVVDFAFRSSPLARYYDGAYVVSGYADVARPRELRDRDAVREWMMETFADGAEINGEHVSASGLVAWLRNETQRTPLAFEMEHRKIEAIIAKGER